MSEVYTVRWMTRTAISARPHLTGVQLICIGVLWGVRSSPVAIFFPLFIIGMMPLRMLLEVGPAGHCSPRHPRPLESSCPELNGIL